jgi:hypothetical protein
MLEGRDSANDSRLAHPQRSSGAASGALAMEREKNPDVVPGEHAPRLFTSA